MWDVDYGTLSSSLHPQLLAGAELHRGVQAMPAQSWPQPGCSQLCALQHVLYPLGLHFPHLSIEENAWMMLCPSNFVFKDPPAEQHWPEGSVLRAGLSK